MPDYLSAAISEHSKEEMHPLPQLAAVCFITDTGACSGNSFNSGANTEDGGHGAPGGSGGNGDDDKDPNYELNNAERCKKEGYTLKTCSSVQDPVNRCPYDTSFFEKCVCKSDLVTCTKPQYGVGESCGGKYASCETDNPRACKEDGYTNTCVTGQKLRKDKRCQYDSSFGICCTESCAANTSLTCTGANAGDDGCGYTCKQCCVTSCPSGFSEYTASNIPAGYVRNGTEVCNRCDGKNLVKIVAAPCDGYPSTCNYGVYNANDYCLSGSTKKYKSSNCKPCTPSCSNTEEYERGCPDCKRGYPFASNGCGGSCYQCSQWIEKTCWTSCRNYEREEGVFCGEWIMVDYLSCGGTKPSQRGNERQCNFGWNPTQDMCGKYESYMSSRKC